MARHALILIKCVRRALRVRRPRFYFRTAGVTCTEPFAVDTVARKSEATGVDTDFGGRILAPSLRPPTNIFLDAFRQGMRGHGYRRRVQQQVAELLKEAVPNVSRVAILCTAAWIEGTNSVCGGHGHIASRHPLRLTPWRRRNRRRSIP